MNDHEQHHLDELRRQRDEMRARLASLEAGNTEVRERDDASQWTDATAGFSASLRSWIAWFDRHIAHHEQAARK